MSILPPPDARALLDCWFAPPESAWMARWFRRDDSFDAMLEDRFGAIMAAAREGALADWEAAPHGALALVIALDQLPRNIARGTPAAFAADPLARASARRAIASGFDRDMRPEERMFLYLPCEHSEDLADQQESLRLFEQLRNFPGMDFVMEYAERHHEVIVRFGRFPHRNAVLGRSSTADELDFLAKRPDGF